MNAIYQFTVPLFAKRLTALSSLLGKAKAQASEKGLDEAELLAKRIAPDMFPLIRQVQIACDNAKGASARLAGMEIPAFADDEQSIEDVQARIKKTLAFLETVHEDAFAEAADRQITLPYFPGTYMTGFDYAREHAIPNFLFHVVTAYGILRKEGLAIGKSDFMDGLPMKAL